MAWTNAPHRPTATGPSRGFSRTSRMRSRRPRESWSSAARSLRFERRCEPMIKTALSNTKSHPKMSKPMSLHSRGPSSIGSCPKSPNTIGPASLGPCPIDARVNFSGSECKNRISRHGRTLGSCRAPSRARPYLRTKLEQNRAQRSCSSAAALGCFCSAAIDH